MPRQIAAFLFGLMLLVAPATRAADAAATAAPERPPLDDRFWKRIADREPWDTMGLRSLFSYLLEVCQSRQHPERLERLCDLAAQAQDHDPKAKSYGNLKWTWRDAGVTDYNAVEFCMQDAIIAWLKHRPWMPPAAREKLQAVIELSIEGCLRHRVPVSYTNIAILNSSNLILLGEAFDRPAVVEEGLRRLEGVCLYTWAYGTHEYCSPTYYAPDTSGLQLIYAHAKTPRAKQLAVGLLTLYWSDVAANWFPASQKLGGAQSRSYDYLRGRGELDRVLVLAGWLPPDTLGKPAFDRLEGPRWAPPAGLRQAAEDRAPRRVRQAWGLAPAESRWAMLHSDVALSVAGATYGSQDVTLAVDLPGPRDAVRCYFIPDGREDPYGVKKYETSSARHMKALHLAPFWAATQRDNDALGLCLYRPDDLKGPEVFNVQSHFVFRRGFDQLWINGQESKIPAGDERHPGRLPLAAGDAVVLRYDSALIGLRIIWSRSQNGEASPAALVDDGNKQGALRLSIDHRSDTKAADPGVALWVRIGSQLDAGSAARWRAEFQAAKCLATDVAPGKMQIAVAGQHGPLKIDAQSPFAAGSAVALDPPPYRGTLELNGREIGRPILEALDLPALRAAQGNPLKSIAVAAHGPTQWEAESGLVLPGFQVDREGNAGPSYVWQPDNKNVVRYAGTVSYTLDVKQAGRYYLWARVLAPNPESDSLYMQLWGQGVTWPAKNAWHLRCNPQWQWQQLALEKAKEPMPLDLPAGPVRLVIQPRELGAKIDALFLTPDAKAKPQ